MPLLAVPEVLIGAPVGVSIPLQGHRVGELVGPGFCPSPADWAVDLPGRAQLPGVAKASPGRPGGADQRGGGAVSHLPPGVQSGELVGPGVRFPLVEQDSVGNYQTLGKKGKTKAVWCLERRGVSNMTNEELASKIQAGERDKVLELWEQVQRFAWKQGKRWAAHPGSGMELGDFVQVGFLAMLDALEGWKSGEAGFLTWYAMRLKAAFTEATGQRTQRDRMDPLQDSVSLDVPVNDDGGGKDIALGETIPDRAAERNVEYVVEWDFAKRRRAAVREALAALPEDQRRAVVLRYWAGRPVDPKIHREALRALRRPTVSRGLREYL